MPPLNLLPSEICFHILQHLSRKDVGECIRLCKSWSQPSLEEYYKKVTLSSRKIEFLKPRQFLKEGDQDYQHLEHGKWTAELEIYDQYYEDGGEDDTYDDDEMERLLILQQKNAKLEKEEFLHLLSFMKNLKKINFAEIVHSPHYMDIKEGLHGKG